MNLKEKLGSLWTAEIEKALEGVKVYVADGDNDYVPKHRFDEVNAKNKELQKVVDENNAKIVELGKDKLTAEEYQAKITELTNANQKAITEWQTKYDDLEFNSSVKQLATKLNIKDKFVPQFINSLDRKTLEKDETGAFKGLDEKAKKIIDEFPEFINTTDPSSAGAKHETPKTQANIYEEMLKM